MLFISEKPSIAEAIANLLSKSSYSKQQSHSTPIFHFNYSGQSCCSTSVAGHLFSLNFSDDYQPWSTDEEKLFQLGHIIAELSKGAGSILSQLRDLTKQYNQIILSLDADREGENICFEIINNLKLNMAKVKRLRFSALTPSELQRAMSKLDKPDKNLSDAVEVRQELDLKVGIAFTRYQTKFFNDKYSNLNTKTISYGPCQTPTLNFCVERQDEILHFKPKKLYGINCKFPDFSCNYDCEFDQREQAEEIEKKLRGQCGTVIKQTKKSERSAKPFGMNTVSMLKKASEKMHMSPMDAMRKAEELYMEGYITYPRTESSSYPDSFNFREIIEQLSENGYQDECKRITSIKPRKGVDAGDHPPITPTSKPFLQKDGFYSMICRNFIASILQDAEYEIIDSTIKVENIEFSYRIRKYIEEGWHSVYKNTNQNDDEIDVNGSTLQIGSKFAIEQVMITERYTKPPGYLTESQLLSLMEKHQIGTDASMATHIQNIGDRGYVKIGQNRTLIPSELGIQLINGLRAIDTELVSSNLRASMENELEKVAQGIVSKQTMIEQQLHKYLNKFIYFKTNIMLMDQLFEAKFITLKQAGKPFVQCGQCFRFTKLISQIPQRIYCPTCDRMYQAVQNGRLVEMGGRRCAYCEQQLVCSVIGGKDKRTIFCPKCYTDGHAQMNSLINDLEERDVGAKNVTCVQCLNKGCEVSLANNYLGECVECGGENGYNEEVVKVCERCDDRKDEKEEIQIEKKEQVKQEAKKEEVIQNGDIQITIAPQNDDILITFDDDMKISVEPVKQQQATKPDQQQQSKFDPHHQRAPQNYLQHMLYFDVLSLQQASVYCTSCQFIANLPAGKYRLSKIKCEECDRMKVDVIGKDEVKAQCVFCEMEGVDMGSSKFVHQGMKRGGRGKFGKYKGKGRK